jgi:GTP-binding protein HflX
LRKYGQSFSKTNLKSFEKLLTRKVLPYQVVSPELASELAELANELQTQISVLIDRRGKVRQYYIGDISKIKDVQAQAAREGLSRLAQLRLIVASPSLEVTKSELLMLKRYRFDLMLFIHASLDNTFSRSKGEFLEFADYGILCSLSSHELGWKVEDKTTIRKIAQAYDCKELIQTIEEDLASIQTGIEVKKCERAILVGLAQSNNSGWDNYEDSFSELYGLATTAGAEICHQLTQNIDKPDSKYYIGSGKVEELHLIAEEKEADLVIFDAELSPAQSRNIERILGDKIKVIDRTELILDIFAQRAKTDEGKLQVELAQMKYMAPRLAGSGTALSKLGGGIGTRGPGETKLEVQRRRIKERITFLEKKVDQISKNRSLQRRLRKQKRIPIVAIAGYTNAGKSTLFNSITGSDVLAENKLFATLDPTIRQINNPRPFLIIDTVGFIQKLPTTLISSFRATLEEIQEADMIVVVAESNHPNRIEHLQVIEKVFEDLEVEKYKRLLVFNKCDLLTDEDKNYLEKLYPEALFISAQKKIGLKLVIEKMMNVLDEASIEEGHQEVKENIDSE